MKILLRKKEKKTSDLGEYLEIAKGKLEEPTGCNDWEMSPYWINRGRRPMVDYPNLWFTALELAEILKDWDETEVPRDFWRQGFQYAEDWITEKAENGDISPDRYPAYLALRGWVKDRLAAQIWTILRLRRMGQ